MHTSTFKDFGDRTNRHVERTFDVLRLWFMQELCTCFFSVQEHTEILSANFVEPFVTYARERAPAVLFTTDMVHVPFLIVIFLMRSQLTTQCRVLKGTR